MADRHEDERGIIQDLLVGPIDSVTHIFTKKDAIRGNHQHKHTTQWTYVVSGRLLVVTMQADVRYERVHKPGDIGCEPPGVPHAWQALEDTEVLVFTRGPRAGSEYENDTQRLERPLL